MASVKKRNDGRVGFRSLDYHDDVTLYPREWFGNGKTQEQRCVIAPPAKAF